MRKMDITLSDIQDIPFNSIPVVKKSVIGKSRIPNIITVKVKSKERIFRNAILLTPGQWADSVSNMYNDYPKEILKKYARNIKDNIIDFDHEYRKVLSRIGRVENQHWDESKNAIVGDLYITTQTQVARDVISLIDEGLINGVSVELGTRDVWDYSKDMPRVEYIEFYGVSIVPKEFAACRDARIK